MRPVSSILFLLAALCAVYPPPANARPAIPARLRVATHGPVLDWRMQRAESRPLERRVSTAAVPADRQRADFGESGTLAAPDSLPRFQRPPPSV